MACVTEETVLAEGLSESDWPVDVSEGNSFERPLM